MPWRYLVGLGCDGPSPWNATTPCMAAEATRHGITALKPTAQRVGAAITRCQWNTPPREPADAASEGFDWRGGTH
eukprot:5613189-Prymnesium_polylepis.1